MEYEEDITQVINPSSDFYINRNDSLYSDTITEPFFTFSSPTPDTGRDESIAFWEITILALMFIVALVGNVLVLIALLLRRQKLTRMYYFILHLCISDLIVAFMNILPQLCWDITFHFQGDNFLCKLVKMLQLFGPYLSSYVLVVTAIDRYLAICYPLSSSPWTMRHSQRMILAAWILAALLSLPQLFIFSYMFVPMYDTYDCWATFIEPYGEIAYITYYSVANTLIPLVVLVFTYSAISLAVWKNFRHKKKSPKGDFNGISSSPSQLGYPASQSKGDTLEITSMIPERNESRLSGSERMPINPRIHSINGISRAKIKTIKLTVVVIACYILCSMPFTCSMLLMAYYPEIAQTAFYNGMGMALFSLLASLNSCVNPWVYLGFNENLVQSLVQFFCCKSREPNGSHRFLPTHYSRSSISDVIAGNKVVNLGNGVVGWTAGSKGTRQNGSSPAKYPSPRRSPSSMPPTLVRQMTRTTSITDDHGSDRALLTSSTPSVSTTASESIVLGGKMNGMEGSTEMNGAQLASTPENRTLRKNSASAPGTLVCSDQHEELFAKDSKCACQEV